jgi:hypothetical protein
MFLTQNVKKMVGIKAPSFKDSIIPGGPKKVSIFDPYSVVIKILKIVLIYMFYKRLKKI